MSLFNMKNNFTKNGASMKKKSFKIFKSILCKLFWYFFILQSLIIVYFIAPKPCNPMIMIENDFIKIDGPNIVKEGNKKNVYTLNITENLNQELNVTLKYSGTAKRGLDYIAPKYVTIKKGEMSADFNIDIIDDPIAEFNDEFAVRIMSITGNKFFNEYNVSNASNVIFTKIVDEKSPKHEDNQSTIITIDGAENIYENNQTTQYIVKLSQNAIEDIDLNISYKGNAEYGVDYIAPHHLVIKKGESLAKFTIQTIDDIYKEHDENIDIYISDFDDIGFEDIRYERSHFNVHLKDEKNPSQALLVELHSPQQATENTPITYKLTSSEVVIDDVSLPFSIKSDDYNIYKDVIIATIEKGKKEVTFSFDVKDDNIIENKQKLILLPQSTLSDVYELIIINTKDNKTLIIDNPNDKTQSAKIILSSAINTFVEDSQALEVTITSSQTILKNLEFLISYEGIAQDGIDFQGAKTATIKQGETTTKFIIKALNDNIAEVKESFSIFVKPTSNGGLENIAEIKPLELMLSDEASSMNKTAFVSLDGPSKIAEATDGNYSIHISQKLEDALEVQLTFIDNTAKASTDFSPIASIKIPKGALSQSFNIHAIDNEIAQTVRDFTIKIKALKGGGFERLDISPTNNSLQATITDEVDIENAFKRIVASKKIVFEYAKASVDEKSFPILNDIATLLIQFPSVDLIVEGHTNSSGHRGRNLKLSKRRAKSVANYLITQGVKKSRISSVGYGQSRPMVNDSNPKAQEINKRVEFKVKYRSTK